MCAAATARLPRGRGPVRPLPDCADFSLDRRHEPVVGMQQPGNPPVSLGGPMTSIADSVGQQVFYIDTNMHVRDLRVWGCAEGHDLTALAITSFPGPIPGNPDVAPDEELVYYVGSSGHVRRIDRIQRCQWAKCVLSLHEWACHPASFKPRGSVEQSGLDSQLWRSTTLRFYEGKCQDKYFPIEPASRLTIERLAIFVVVFRLRRRLLEMMKKGLPIPMLRSPAR